MPGLGLDVGVPGFVLDGLSMPAANRLDGVGVLGTRQIPVRGRPQQRPIHALFGANIHLVRAGSAVGLTDLSQTMAGQPELWILTGQGTLKNLLGDGLDVSYDLDRFRN